MKRVDITIPVDGTWGIRALATDVTAILKTLDLPGIAVRTIHVWRTVPLQFLPAPTGIGAGSHYLPIHFSICIAVRILQAVGYRGWQIKQIVASCLADAKPLDRVIDVINDPEGSALCEACGQPLPVNRLRGEQ